MGAKVMIAKLKSHKGMTLIELIVSLAASLIMLTAVASLLTYGFNMYNQAVDLNDAHNMALLTMQDIVNEVSYANVLIIHTNKPATVGSGLNCLYVADGRLTKLTSGSGTPQEYFKNYNSKLTCVIEYTKTQNSDNSLTVTIDVKDNNNQLLENTTVIAINNMGSNSFDGNVINDDDTDHTSGSVGYAIEYSLPPSS
jgi:prepilin-type N-terminal cleavage/methylation domain-containing protein